jgi:hypothetical protein
VRFENQNVFFYLKNADVAIVNLEVVGLAPGQVLVEEVGTNLESGSHTGLPDFIWYRIPKPEKL